MPQRPLRPCGQMGCPELVTTGRCTAHQREAYRKQDQQRGSAAQRGYDSKWNKARKGYLAKHPWCAECKRQGRATPATLVDHIIPHRGDMKLFWDSSNWQSLCNEPPWECHNRKRQQESMEGRRLSVGG